MANSVTTINPLSTASAFVPDFRGEGGNSYVLPSLPVTVSVGVSMPKLAADAYPAVFSAVPDGARTASHGGIIIALTPSKVAAFGTAGFGTAAATTADYVVVSISDGVISITNASTNAATAATVYTVNRLN